MPSLEYLLPVGSDPPSVEVCQGYHDLFSTYQTPTNLGDPQPSLEEFIEKGHHVRAEVSDTKVNPFIVQRSMPRPEERTQHNDAFKDKVKMVKQANLYHVVKIQCHGSPGRVMMGENSGPHG